MNQNGRRLLFLLVVFSFLLILGFGYAKVAADPFAPQMLTPPANAPQVSIEHSATHSPMHKTPEVIPSDVTADPVISAILSRVNTVTVHQLDGDLSGAWPVNVGGQPYTFQTRYTYSGTPIQKATQYVGEQFAAMGLAVEYHQWSGSNYPNVIAELPGQTDPNQIYIICAHLDSTSPSAQTSAPGADDNASGSVGVLLAAELLSNYEWDYTLRFALWTGEEQGLLGSDAYAARSAASGEQIVGVLNMDMIAYNSDLSPIIDLHARSWLPDSVNMANLFDDVVDEYSLALQPDVLIDDWLGNYSDNKSFWDENYTAILVIEDYDDFTPYYHTTNDTLSTLNLSYFAEAVKASLGTFAHMSGPPWRGYASGTVTAVSDGTPISSALVRFTHPQRPAAATVTDASGVYTITLATGSYTMTVSAPGYNPWSLTNVTINKDGTTIQDVVLGASSSNGYVQGVVTDLYHGSPIAGAQVALTHTTYVTITTVLTTNSAGTYTTTLPAGTYLMRVGAVDYHPTLFYSVQVNAGNVTTQNATLEPLPGYLHGHITAVVTPTTPVTNALVTLTAPSVSVTATTDAAGYYTLTLPALTYTMSVTANGYHPQTLSGIVVTSSRVTVRDAALFPIAMPDYQLYLPAVVAVP